MDTLQLAAALVHAGALVAALPEHAVTRYVEVGMFSGWTTCLVSAFLARVRNGPFEGYTIDVTDKRLSDSTRSLFAALNITYLPAESASRLLLPLAPFDLCLIDGDHSFIGVSRDYAVYAPRCANLMFHDIADERILKHGLKHGGGVPGFWVALLGRWQEPARVRQFFMQGGRRCVFGIGVVRAGSDYRPPGQLMSVEPSSRAVDDWLRQLHQTWKVNVAKRLHQSFCDSGNPLCEAMSMGFPTLHPARRPWTRPVKDGFGGQVATQSAYDYLGE